MGAQSRPRSGVGSNAAFRHYTYYRSAILVLLKEQESHGYELVGRLAEMGFESRVAASLYSVLRDMEEEGLVTSSWDISQGGGPPRRVYGCTAGGDRYLSEAVPVLVRQRYALGMMIDRFGTVAQREGRQQPTGRVLIVDDDRDTRHMLWALLVDRGWEVDEAADAEEALAVGPRLAQGIVVVGDRVVGVAGVEVARRFRDQGFEGLIVMYAAAIDKAIQAQAEALRIELLPKAEFSGLPDLLAARS